MANAVNDRDAVELGRNADLVLSNPAYVEAMERMKREVIEAWKACPVRDREGQLLLLQLAKLTDKFGLVLSGMVEGGKLAQHKINIDAERNESPARRILRKVA